MKTPNATTRGSGADAVIDAAARLTTPITRSRQAAADLRALCERSVHQNRRSGARIVPPMVSVGAVLNVLERYGL